MLKCKYGCGMTFPDKASLMRHYRWECEKSPVVQKWKDKKAKTKEKKSFVETTAKKPPVDGNESVLYDAIREEVKLLKAERELRMLRGLGSSDAGSDDGKITCNIEGQSVKLSSSEYMHWIQQKREREDRKLERELKSEKKEIDMIGELRKQNLDLQTAMFNFQSEILTAQMQHSPIDSFLQTSEKLEQLGISRSGSARDELLKQDSKKLDMLLTIIDRKDLSVEKKVDRAIERFGPSIVDYLKEMVVAMKQQRGIIPGEKRTDKDYEKTLKTMEQMEQKLKDQSEKKDVDEIPVTEPVKKVISSGKEKKHPSANKKTKEIKNVRRTNK